MSEPSTSSDDLLSELEAQSVEYIDKRPNGGALWVVGGAELSTMMSDMAKRGYKFTFNAGGGRATGHLPAWWIARFRHGLALQCSRRSLLSKTSAHRRSP